MQLVKLIHNPLLFGNKMNKLETLMDIEGYNDVYDLLDELMTDSICPCICINPDCDYTCEVEPDCTNGWCENCSTPTVQSALVIAGIF